MPLLDWFKGKPKKMGEGETPPSEASLLQGDMTLEQSASNSDQVPVSGKKHSAEQAVSDGASKAGTISGPAAPAEDDVVPAPSYIAIQGLVKSQQTVILLLIVGLIVAVGGYHFILPLKKIEPVYMALNTQGDHFVYKLMPASDIDSRESLVSYFLRQYVVEREKVDRVTWFNSIETVRAMSSPEVFEHWQKVMLDDQTGLYKQNGFKRQIEILMDGPVAQKGANYFVHEVVFRTIDTNEQVWPDKKEVREWNSKIAYRWNPQRVQVQEGGAILNPAGLFVIEVTTKEIHRGEGD